MASPFILLADRSLLAVAERVTKLTAICVCCGEEATRTQRIINGKEAYEDDRSGEHSAGSFCGSSAQQ